MANPVDRPVEMGAPFVVPRAWRACGVSRSSSKARRMRNGRIRRLSRGGLLCGVVSYPRASSRPLSLALLCRQPVLQLLRKVGCTSTTGGSRIRAAATTLTAPGPRWTTRPTPLPESIGALIARDPSPTKSGPVKGRMPPASAFTSPDRSGYLPRTSEDLRTAVADCGAIRRGGHDRVLPFGTCRWEWPRAQKGCAGASGFPGRGWCGVPARTRRVRWRPRPCTPAGRSRRREVGRRRPFQGSVRCRGL